MITFSSPTVFHSAGPRDNKWHNRDDHYNGGLNIGNIFLATLLSFVTTRTQVEFIRSPGRVDRYPTFGEWKRMHDVSMVIRTIRLDLSDVEHSTMAVIAEISWAWTLAMLSRKLTRDREREKAERMQERGVRMTFRLELASERDWRDRILNKQVRGREKANCKRIFRMVYGLPRQLLLPLCAIDVVL